MAGIAGKAGDDVDMAVMSHGLACGYWDRPARCHAVPEPVVALLWFWMMAGFGGG